MGIIIIKEYLINLSNFDRMNKFLIVSIILASCLVYIDAHAEILSPVNRGAAWRYLDGFPGKPDNDKLPNGFTESNEWCAAINNIVDRVPKSGNQRDATCGICGPVYSNDPKKWYNLYKAVVDNLANVTSTEVGSDMYSGKIVETYKQGSTIEVRIHVPAKHKGGPHSFHICESPMGEDPTQECLDANQLEFDNGELEREIDDVRVKGARLPPNNTLVPTYLFKIKLPADLKCEHCVLQWKWFARSNQEYHSCADVKIE